MSSGSKYIELFIINYIKIITGPVDAYNIIVSWTAKKLEVPLVFIQFHYCMILISVESCSGASPIILIKVSVFDYCNVFARSFFVRDRNNSCRPELNLRAAGRLLDIDDTINVMTLRDPC